MEERVTVTLDRKELKELIAEHLTENGYEMKSVDFRYETQPSLTGGNSTIRINGAVVLVNRKIEGVNT